MYVSASRLLCKPFSFMKPEAQDMGLLSPFDPAIAQMFVFGQESDR